MSNQLPTDYQSFIHKSRYAKYFDGEGRAVLRLHKGLLNLGIESSVGVT